MSKKFCYRERAHERERETFYTRTITMQRCSLCERIFKMISMVALAMVAQPCSNVGSARQ